MIRPPLRLPFIVLVRDQAVANILSLAVHDNDLKITEIASVVQGQYAYKITERFTEAERDELYALKNALKAHKVEYDSMDQNSDSWHCTTCNFWCRTEEEGLQHMAEKIVEDRRGR